MSAPRNKLRRGERGNVFIFILLGVVLFAALAMVISRSMRTETVTTMSGREAVLAASEILDYAQQLERGVSRLRRKGVSENNISFDSPFVAGYAAGEPEANKIFSAEGGFVKWKAPVPGANDGSDWIFTGGTCIPGIGSAEAGCDSSGTADEALIAVLPNIDRNVCAEIDARLGIGSIPEAASGNLTDSKFIGVFDDHKELVLDGKQREAACFDKIGIYQFYYVLLAR